MRYPTGFWRIVDKHVCRLLLAAALCCTGACLADTADHAPPEHLTLAVLDFAQIEVRQDQQPHRWLSKALCDLLIGDLAVHPSLRLVTRENMRMLMQEAELRTLSGLTEDLIDPGEYERMQRYVKVDRLVLGTFSIHAGHIHLQTQVIDHETGQVLARFSQAGDLAEALDIEKTLARSMLHYFSGGEIPPDAWELPKWTDSMEASEMLYEGVAAFDAGQYNRAWYCFRQALRIDPGYADALYWTGRMHYYRQDYEHAHVVYRTFVERHPNHGRIGDAVTEFVHSQEGGVLQHWHDFSYADADPSRLAHASSDHAAARALLELYRDLRAHDWSGAYVHNKVDYASRSPLADWLIKREQQALTYMGYLTEAFALLDEGMREMPDDPADAKARAWRHESSQLMTIIAMESEDLLGERLVSEFLPARDHQLTVDNPVAGEDLRDRPSMHGQAGNRWGTNWRILAPEGYSFNKIHTTIIRSNDPELSSTCRLQIRRYRYVDIDGCAAGGRGTNSPTIHNKTVQMPPGSTWFFLRPEHYNRVNSQARFDEWRLVAELAPIPDNAGAIMVNVVNALEHNTYLDDIYTRCFNGGIGNLRPGTYNLRIDCMWDRRNRSWAFQPLECQVEVSPGQTNHLHLSLSLTDEVRAMGWNDPVGIASRYPTYKHRPRPDSNWLNGPPAVCVDPRTGQLLAVWSHLDDLWFATSADGLAWSDPDTLPPPVNSADAEINPRLIVDHQGRYCLMFLSNRGMSRNLGVYVSWSRNLQHWTRPVLLSPHHHLDYDFMQNDKGEYLLLLVPSGTSHDGHIEQETIISLQTSRDLLEWSDPVPEESWRQIFDPASRAKVSTSTRPSRARIIQDRYGVYHLAWLRGSEVWRSWSPDLLDWVQPEKINKNLKWSIHNISLTATDERLMMAMISSDGSYSGTEMFAIESTPLPGKRGDMWRSVAIPPLAVSGMPDLTYDHQRRQILLCWQFAEQQLHATRMAGPVYFMTGYPGLQPLQATKLRRAHVNMGNVLDKHLAVIKQGGELSQEDRDRAHAAWMKYHERLKQDLKQDNVGSFPMEDRLGHYLNAFKMAVIDRQRHGGWPIRHIVLRVIFNLIRHEAEVEDVDAHVLAAAIIPAILNDRPDDAVRYYRTLSEKDAFWSDYILNYVQTSVEKGLGRFANNPEALATAQSFLHAVR